MGERSGDGWLLLIHQIPPKPNYFRVKVWRRLQRLGAVAIKNSVYALPKSDAGQEDLQWVLREITEGGGDGSVCEARFVEGLSHEQIRALFHAARDAEYAALAEEARALWDKMPAHGHAPAERVAELSGQMARLRRRLGEVSDIDFFGAPGREPAEGLIAELESHLRKVAEPRRAGRKAKAAGGAYQRRTWVTRKGVHVDRMASAWLIHRFIDPQARFKFVAAKEYRHKAGELRFDMFAAEFTHEGDQCTFEILLDRFGLRDRPLQAIAEIVHDVDLKDGKFRRQEALGIDRLVAGIAMANEADAARVGAASTVWDGLYEYFRRKRV
jgi:hypothetical protein